MSKKSKKTKPQPSQSGLPERIRHAGIVYNVVSRDGDTLTCVCGDGKEYSLPIEECYDEHGHVLIDLE